MKNNDVIMSERDNGDKEWHKDGELHREDGPAIECSNGIKYWYQNGKMHRLDGPAMEFVDGSTLWFKNGKGHRLDGPAIEWARGKKEWRQDGKTHREDGPAVEHDDGKKEWYKHGVRHCLDGPAIKHANGGTEWWVDGVRHRLDGPAIENVNGETEWRVNGELHREDGPALECFGHKEWYKNGKRIIKLSDFDIEEPCVLSEYDDLEVEVKNHRGVRDITPSINDEAFDKYGHMDLNCPVWKFNPPWNDLKNNFEKMDESRSKLNEKQYASELFRRRHPTIMKIVDKWNNFWNHLLKRR